MLKSIDILVGLSVVMLVISMAVTLVNQAILNLLASRGRNLRDGLADMLELLGAGITRKDAETIAEKMLSHPIIGGKIWSRLPARLRRIVQTYKYGEIIHREEFIKMLLGLGASHKRVTAALNDLDAKINTEVAADITAELNKLKEEMMINHQLAGDGFKNMINQLRFAKTDDDRKTQYATLNTAISKQTDPYESLIKSLHKNGINDPAATLKNIRLLALEYEKSYPKLANDVHQTNAILQEASSEFLAIIHMNFDQVMDRVSVRFTSTTRVVGFFSAALIAIALQLDTVYVMNHLSMDDSMRSAFVEQAVKLSNDEAAKESALGSKQDANTKKEKEYLVFLSHQGLIYYPTSFEKWREHWNKVSYLGIFLSILLLSLGAPFWYKILGKLLQLRSVLAEKDDQRRNIRQTTQTLGTSSQQKQDYPT